MLSKKNFIIIIAAVLIFIFVPTGKRNEPTFYQGQGICESVNALNDSSSKHGIPLTSVNIRNNECYGHKNIVRGLGLAVDAITGVVAGWILIMVLGSLNKKP